MSSYVASTEKLILGGSLDELEGFRGDWVTDEALKWPFMEQHPEARDAIHELEDNSLIRGRIMAFELDACHGSLREPRRSLHVSQARLRDLLGAALLTKGDYSRNVGWNGERGNSAAPRRTTPGRTCSPRAPVQDLAGIREPLTKLLDDLAERSASDRHSPEGVAQLDL